MVCFCLNSKHALVGILFLGIFRCVVIWFLNFDTEVFLAVQMPHPISRSLSVDNAGKERLLRRDSVAKMTWDGVSFFVQRFVLYLIRCKNCKFWRHLNKKFFFDLYDF